MMDSGFAYLLIVLCLVVLSVSMLRRSEQRRATSRDLTREQLARLRDQTRMRDTMEELLLQLEDVSRRINAQVDTKFAKLEAVVRDADNRIAQLERLQGTSPGPRPPTRKPQPPSAHGEASRRDEGQHEPAEFTPGLGAPSDQAPPTHHAPEDTAPAARPEPEAPPPPSSPGERRARILELADAGTAPMTIADMLQVPLGEVELILSLRGFSKG
jgi:hypothetical protein